MGIDLCGPLPQVEVLVRAVRAVVLGAEPEQHRRGPEQPRSTPTARIDPPDAAVVVRRP